MIVYILHLSDSATYGSASSYCDTVAAGQLIAKAKYGCSFQDLGCDPQQVNGAASPAMLLVAHGICANHEGMYFLSVACMTWYSNASARKLRKQRFSSRYTVPPSFEPC